MGNPDGDDDGDDGDFRGFWGKKTKTKTKTKTKKHYYLKRELAKLDLLALKKKEVYIFHYFKNEGFPLFKKEKQTFLTFFFYQKRRKNSSPLK